MGWLNRAHLAALRFEAFAASWWHALRPLQRGPERTIRLSWERFREASRNGAGPVTELDGVIDRVARELSTHAVALVLIDVWRQHGNAGLQARMDENVRTHLAPLLAAAREAGILVVHSHGRQPVHELATPRPNEIVLRNYDPRALNLVCRRLGVTHLIYAGYVSNMCIINRPVGVFSMNKRGYDIVVVRDASLAMESPASLVDQ